MVIIGSSSNQLRERILRIEDLTLAQAIKLGQAAEATKQHVRELSRQPTATCQHTIDSLKVKPQWNPPRTNHKNQNYCPSTCKYCGTQHRRGQCPAYWKICAKCSKVNHFASVCLSSNRSVHYANTQNEIEQEYLPDSDHFFIGTVDEEPDKVNSSNTSLDNKIPNEQEWFVSLESNGTFINYKLDTGAQANILPSSVVSTMTTKPRLKQTKIKLTAYNGSKIPVIGICKINLQYAVTFVVADTTSPPLLGLNIFHTMNLVKGIWFVDAVKPNFIQEYSDIFGELGCLKGEHHRDRQKYSTCYSPAKKNTNIHVA